MIALRTFLLAGLLLSGVGPVRAEDEKDEVSEKQFRRAALVLLEDPTSDKALEHAKVVLLFTIQTSKAAVFTGDEEARWAGKDKKRSGLLLAAYYAGNTLSQLHSGIKRNDRYSGVLYLFQVYRGLQAADREFKIPEVEELLKLQKEDKLMKHLLDLEAKKPSKLSPEDEEAIKKFREKKDKKE